VAESFRDLVVWQKAIEMALSVYRLTAGFPATERFGLATQMRRAAVSVSSNIAEGAGRATTGEFLQFLGIAPGSNYKLESQCVIACGLHFGSLQHLDATEEQCAATAACSISSSSRSKPKRIPAAKPATSLSTSHPLLAT